MLLRQNIDYDQCTVFEVKIAVVFLFFFFTHV